MSYLLIYQVLMYKSQMHNSIQCACFVTVILQWMRSYRGLPHTPTLPTCFFLSYRHPHQCDTFIWWISQLYGQSTLPIVHSWKNLVHEFGPIYRSVSTMTLLYRYFHSRSFMLWPLTDFFFHGVEWSSSGRFVFYKPLSSLPAFIYFLLRETQRTEGGSGFY